MAIISLKSCDILSPRISLYYKGLLRHSSNCSVLLSILSIFLIIFFSFYFSKEIYYRPGESVGVLAAQLIGEPSTQITLIDLLKIFILFILILQESFIQLIYILIKVIKK